MLLQNVFKEASGGSLEFHADPYILRLSGLIQTRGDTKGDPEHAAAIIL